MDKTENLQDTFLNTARKDRIPVTVIFINGFQMRGVITAFDSFMLQLEAEGKQHLIYKHAISTITPSKPLRIHS